MLAFVTLGGCKPAPKLTPADTTGLDDDFSAPALASSWQIYKGETFRYETREGELIMQPHANVVWYMADSGPMLYKPVSGNFMVSASVRARSIAEPDKPPRGNYQLAGLIARDPASDSSGEENYVFNVVGFRNGYLSVETKTTVDDESEVVGPEWDSGDAELRVCRFNEKFLVLKRHIGKKEWTLGTTYIRKDLPAQLQVGPIAYTYIDKQDMRARFDYIKYSPVKAEQDCYQ